MIIRKQKKRKTISFSNVVAIMSLMWMLLSYLEILCKNVGSGSVYSQYNLFMMIIGRLG